MRLFSITYSYVNYCNRFLAFSRKGQASMGGQRRSELRPPPGSRWREWPQIEQYARRRYAKRHGRSVDDPDTNDYGQEVVTRIYRRFTDEPERYSVGDEFMKLVLGVMKWVARERWNELTRWRKLVTRLSRQWEEFVSSPDPRLLDWQEEFDLIVVPVKARSGGRPGRPSGSSSSMGCRRRKPPMS